MQIKPALNAEITTGSKEEKHWGHQSVQVQFTLKFSI